MPFTLLLAPLIQKAIYHQTSFPISYIFKVHVLENFKHVGFASYNLQTSE